MKWNNVIKLLTDYFFMFQVCIRQSNISFKKARILNFKKLVYYSRYTYGECDPFKKFHFNEKKFYSFSSHFSIHTYSRRPGKVRD